jgi:hypothetical protein
MNIRNRLTIPFLFTTFIAIQPALAQRRNIEASISASTDVARLEKIAASNEGAAAELTLPPDLAKNFPPGLPPPPGIVGWPKDLRTAAYARLGALGNKESLAAIQRLEAAAQKITLTPATASISAAIHPAFHFGDGPRRLLAQVQAADGATYALIPDGLMGADDLFLISTKTPDDPQSWSRPLLLEIPFGDITDLSLALKDAHTLVLHFTQNPPRPRMPGEERLPLSVPSSQPATQPGPHERTLDLDAIRKDTDRDGWTDIEEKRLGLDPANPDADGDSLRDGDDPCPRFAPPPNAARDEQTQILQRAIYATFGISGSRCLLLVDDKSPPVQLWGYAGPVLYNINREQWLKDHGSGGIFVGWKLTIEGNDATVDIKDWEGYLAGGSQKVFLCKIDGQWYVVERRRGLVA